MPLDDYFRQARPGSSRWNLCKTLLQSLVFWFAFLVLMPAALLWIERQLQIPAFHFTGQSMTGAILLMLFSALNLSSGVTMALAGGGTPLPTDGPRRLVVAGPYRYLRNPMAVAGLGQGLSVAVLLGSWSTVAAVVVGGLIWNYGVRPVEERHLQRMFGCEYDRYRQAVRCWIPNATPQRGGGDRQPPSEPEC